MRRMTAVLVLAMLAGCSRGESGEAGPADGSASQSSRDALPVRLFASGNMPFWSARIGMDSLRFSLADPGNARTIRVARAAQGGGIVLSGSVDGQPVRARIMPGDCSDTMSKRPYPYTIELTIGGADFSGCAREEPGGA